MDARALQNTHVFAGIGDESARRIAGIAVLQTTATGQRIFEAGDEATSLYVVERGSVELIFSLDILGNSQDVPVERAGPGAVLAWSALVPPHRLTLSGRAAEETALSRLDRATVLAVLDEDPAAGYLVMSRIAAVVARRFQLLQALFTREIQRQVSEKYK